MRLFGDTLCPNYVISSRALRMERQDLYVAHELAQMIPLHGHSMALRLWSENAWCRDLLPNVHCRRVDEISDRLPMMMRLLKALAQTLLWLPPGERIEQSEQRRKLTKLARQVPPHVDEAQYTPDVCKGHDHGHGERIMQLWLSRTSRTVDSPDSTSVRQTEHPSSCSD